jgi:hypothetical protein
MYNRINVQLSNQISNENLECRYKSENLVFATFTHEKMDDLPFK